MFGADEAESEAAVANAQRMYPDLKIVGHSRLSPRGRAANQGRRDQRAGAGLSLGRAWRSYEQAFVEEFTHLSNVGVIKTSGGLFVIFCRAAVPPSMDTRTWDWNGAWRIWLEPRRLFWPLPDHQSARCICCFKRASPRRPGGLGPDRSDRNQDQSARRFLF